MFMVLIKTTLFSPKSFFQNCFKNNFQQFFQKLGTFSAKGFIIGGDFNLILNNTLDKTGGSKDKNAQARNNVILHMNILD